jgi:thiamine-phosphate pyrophosphorylase
MGITKANLKKAQLYLVLDREVCDYGRLWEVLKEAAASGVDVIQLRDKIGSGRQVLEFATQAVKFLKHRVLFIVNDRVDLALASGADGVHVGQEDMPIKVVRKLMGNKAIIGSSCQSLAQAQAAQKQGADYIGFGSVFKTLTKPDRQPMDLQVLKQTVNKIKIPVFAIGGINLENVGQLSRAGIKKIAVTRAICLSDDVAKTVKQFREQG